MEKHTTTAKSKITRRNYSRISGSLELPNLVEIQTNSYKWFKEVGIKEVFDDIYPITNFNETLSLEFVDCAFDEPKYSVNESKDRDANYAAPIRATLRLINSGTGEIKEQEKKLEELHQMRHALQHNAKEAYEAVYGKTDEAAEVKHTTVEEMEKELHENAEHQMEYVNELKNKSLKK